MAQLIPQPPSTGRTALPLRLAAAIAVAVLLTAGVLWLGRIATNDSDAMLWTTGWFVLVAAGGLLLAMRRRDLLLPVAVGYVAVLVAVAVFLGRPILFDDVVNERVVTGTPASDVETRARPANVEVASGTFEGVRHSGSGRAAVVRLPGGERKLTLTEFDVSNGPDLFVYLAAGSPTDEEQVDDYVDLGRLKGNKGNQQYTIPTEVDIPRYSTVVIWCRAFTVLFARAELRPS